MTKLIFRTFGLYDSYGWPFFFFFVYGCLLSGLDRMYNSTLRRETTMEKNPQWKGRLCVIISRYFFLHSSRWVFLFIKYWKVATSTLKFSFLFYVRISGYTTRRVNEMWTLNELTYTQPDPSDADIQPTNGKLTKWNIKAAASALLVSVRNVQKSSSLSLSKAAALCQVAGNWKQLRQSLPLLVYVLFMYFNFH